MELVLCGHTHIPKIEEKGGILYINPGHLKKKDKKGYPPSFASVEFTREKVDAKIIDLKSKEIILEREMLKP
ncbi:MAG: metallophosphoesterase family protein [Candidatus Syntropharchaeia archaeon]